MAFKPGSPVSDTNRMPVQGPSDGSPADAAWDGAAASPSIISLLKGLFQRVIKPDGVLDGTKVLNWGAGTGNAIDATGFATLVITVSAISGGAISIAVNGSISGATQHALAIFDEGPAQANLSAITTAGIYSVSGNGLLSYVITGPGTATVNAILKRI